MAGNVPPNANQPVNPNPPPSWRDRTPLKLATPLHALPHNAEKALPKFDLGKGILVPRANFLFSFRYFSHGA